MAFFTNIPINIKNLIGSIANVTVNNYNYIVGSLPPLPRVVVKKGKCTLCGQPVDKRGTIDVCPNGNCPSNKEARARRYMLLAVITLTTLMIVGILQYGFLLLANGPALDLDSSPHVFVRSSIRSSDGKVKVSFPYKNKIKFKYCHGRDCLDLDRTYRGSSVPKVAFHTHQTIPWIGLAFDDTVEVYEIVRKRLIPVGQHILHHAGNDINISLYKRNNSEWLMLCNPQTHNCIHYALDKKENVWRAMRAH